jgi:FkbM family methyltransferase
VFDDVLIKHAYDVELAKKPATIVDAGANIGLTSIFFAMKFPAASVLAIEPEKENFKLLEQNTQKFPNIVPIRAALWSENKPLQLANPDNSSWAFQTSASGSQPIENTQETHQVRGINMENILREYGIDHVDLLKIDIEGAEKEVFEVNTSWVDCVDVIVIELHDRLKSGCTEVFRHATESFEIRYQSGESTVVARNGTIILSNSSTVDFKA